MKLKLNLVWMLAVVFTGLAFGQSLEMGPTYEAESKYYDPTIIGEDEENIYMFEAQGNFYLLEAFKKDGFERVYSREVAFKESAERNFDISRVIFSKGNILVFASHYDKSRKTSLLYAYKVSSKKGLILGKRHDILEVKNSKFIGLSAYELSEDQSKILLAHQIYSKKYNRTTVKYRLYNSNLEELLSKDLELDGSQTEVFPSGTIIDNDGSVFTIHYNMSGFKLTVYDADKDFEKWTEDVKIKGLEVGEEVVSAQIKMDANGDILTMGYYANEDGNIKGYVYIKIDAFTKEIIDQRKTYLPHGIEEKFQTFDEYRRDKKGRLDGHFANRIINLKDGSFLFLSEEVGLSRNYVNGGLSSEYYNYGGVLVSKFGADGKLDWTEKIDKDQQYFWSNFLILFKNSSAGMTMSSPNYLKKHYSYLPFVDDKNVYILYLDDPINAEITNRLERKIMKMPKKSVPVLFKIDLETGEKFMRNVKYDKESGMLLVVQSSNQEEQNNDVFLMLSGKKNYKFGILEF